MTLAVAAALAAWKVLDDSPYRVGIAAGIALLGVSPPLAVVPPAAAVGWRGWRRLSRQRARSQAASADVALLAELVGLGLRAGLPIRTALAQAAPHVAAPLRSEVESVLDAADRNGTAVGLAAGTGRAAGLYRAVATAAATGAPVEVSVAAFAAEQRRFDQARRLDAVRRLPVRMLVPLALLVLPGFVILVVGPALIESLSRLGPLR